MDRHWLVNTTDLCRNHPFDSSTSTYYSHTSPKTHPSCNCNEVIITGCETALTLFPKGDHTATQVVIAPSSRFLSDAQSSWSGRDVAPPGPATFFFPLRLVQSSLLIGCRVQRPHTGHFRPQFLVRNGYTFHLSSAGPEQKRRPTLQSRWRRTVCRDAGLVRPWAPEQLGCARPARPAPPPTGGISLQSSPPTACALRGEACAPAVQLAPLHSFIEE